MLATGRRWVLMHELREEPEPTLAELLAHLQPVDLVLVEGWKTGVSQAGSLAAPRRGQATTLSKRPEHCRRRL